MGAEVHIRLENDKYDEKGLAPFLGRDFQSEITTSALWETHEPFLDQNEIDLLYAPYYDFFDDNTVQLIEPSKLKSILEKIDCYLEHNKDSLPFEIDIDYERMEKENLPTDLIINDSSCWIQGDSFYYDVTDKFKIVNHNLESNEVELWVEFKEKVKIENSFFYLKKEYRYEKYKNDLNEVINFCQLAINTHQKIYWLFQI
ncbi:conserved protein of unknown function [Tenacibaculum sp. 190130A14a]|uniref:Uncharacterized protein n=1 Tax=Tenacibaculum polynesiense TaxID=3137857 RepID=A0ABM9PDP9_9FLAO